MLAQRTLVVALVPYAAWLVLDYDYHFIDGVNLLFHEAGHLFLTPFGKVLHFLGGTLGQLFFPAACAFHFLREDRRFEAAVCTLWLGESLMYAAEYVADARAQLLPLVGGHIHDWAWLLGRWSLLQHCEQIGVFVHGVGSLVVLGALVAAAQRAFAPAPPSPEPPAAVALGRD